MSKCYTLFAFSCQMEQLVTRHVDWQVVVETQIFMHAWTKTKGNKGKNEKKEEKKPKEKREEQQHQPNT